MKKKEIEETPIKNNNKSNFSTILKYIKSFIPLFLSHHPECEAFKGHTINIKKYRFCIGCFVGYPTAIIGIFLIYYFKLNELIPSHYLLIFGIIFLSTFILSPLNLTEIKINKILQKFCIGFSAALIFWWIQSLSMPNFSKFIIFLIIFGTLLTALNVYHTYGFYKHCKKCKTPLDWANCSGFETIRENMRKYDLENILPEGLPQLIYKKRKKRKNK